MKSFLVLTVAASAFISSSASAAIATFQQYGAWQFAVTNGILLPAPLSIITENFNAYSGSYSNRLVGSTGPIDWSAAAVSNVPIATNIVANSGWLSTNGADENLVFSFAPLWSSCRRRELFHPRCIFQRHPNSCWNHFRRRFILHSKCHIHEWLLRIHFE